MADGIDIRVSEISETVRAMQGYSNQLGDVVIKKALAEGAKLMKKKIQAETPVALQGSQYFPAGRLKKNIMYKLSKINRSNRNGVIGYYVRVKEKGGSRYGNQRNAYYGHMLENGHKTRNPNISVAPTHFFSNAERNAQREVENLVQRLINEGADDIARRLGL